MFLLCPSNSGIVNLYVAKDKSKITQISENDIHEGVGRTHRNWKKDPFEILAQYCLSLMCNHALPENFAFLGEKQQQQEATSLAKRNIPKAPPKSDILTPPPASTEKPKDLMTTTPAPPPSQKKSRQEHHRKSDSIRSGGCRGGGG
jgi:hypothetical protein